MKERYIQYSMSHLKNTPRIFVESLPQTILFSPLYLSYFLYISFLTVYCITPSCLVQVQQCPYCNYSSKDANRMQLHVMSQHSMQPVIRCPLCQDVLSNKIHLQLHLTHLHSVAPDCVEKLILTVSGNRILPQITFKRKRFSKGKGNIDMKSGDGDLTQIKLPKCTRLITILQ